MLRKSVKKTVEICVLKLFENHKSRKRHISNASVFGRIYTRGCPKMDQIWPNLTKKMSKYTEISRFIKIYGSATEFLNGNYFLSALTTEN